MASATRTWVERNVGIIRDVEPLIGGMSSRMHRCRLDDGRAIVVRHIDDADWLAREPYLISSEAFVLELLDDSDVPVPKLIASDPEAGLLAMTFVPGSVRIADAPVESFAEVAARIAAVALPDECPLPAWRPWVADALVAPDWGDAQVWSRAIDVFGQLDPPTGKALLHRDFHALNFLWAGDEVAGVVDWVNACTGHPHAELGHCRWNLAVSHREQIVAADRFLDRYLSTADDAGPYSPYWDLATILSVLPGPIRTDGYQTAGRGDLTPEVVTTRTERFLEHIIG